MPAAPNPRAFDITEQVERGGFGAASEPAPTEGCECIIARVTADLQQNFGEPIRLNEIGKATGYSVYQLIRLFRRDLGVTPHAYLMRLRTDYAAARLAEGESIAGAAAEAGFADQSHLTRHFKRVFGTTPGQFMRSRQIEAQPAG